MCVNDPIHDNYTRFCADDYIQIGVTVRRLAFILFVSITQVHNILLSLNPCTSIEVRMFA